MPNQTPFNQDRAAARAMAANVAAWTDVSVRAYGIATESAPGLWWRQPGASPIYLAAVILDAQIPDRILLPELSRMARAWGAAGQEAWVYDCAATRDLRGVGFERLWKTPWYLRPAGPFTPAALPEGLTLESASTPQQLADFEQATWKGFEESDTDFPDRERFSQHPPASLEDPDMVYLNARLEGQVVSSTIAYITHDMVGIYGLSTLPMYRRRGYARALVQASVALRPDLPVSVYPDPVSVPIYREIGFSPAGEIAVWRKAVGSGQ